MRFLRLSTAALHFHIPFYHSNFLGLAIDQRGAFLAYSHVRHSVVGRKGLIKMRLQVAYSSAHIIHIGALTY